MSDQSPENSISPEERNTFDEMVADIKIDVKKQARLAEPVYQAMAAGASQEAVDEIIKETSKGDASKGDTSKSEGLIASASQKAGSFTQGMGEALRDPAKRKGVFIAGAAVAVAALSVTYLINKFRERRAARAAAALPAGAATAMPQGGHAAREQARRTQRTPQQQQSSFLGGVGNVAAGLGMIDEKTQKALQEGDLTKVAAGIAATHGGEKGELAGAALNGINGGDKTELLGKVLQMATNGQQEQKGRG